MTLWHTLGYNGGEKPHLSHNDDREVRLGKWISVDRPIQFGKRGLHYASAPLFALRYAPHDTSRVRFCQVEVGGSISVDEYAYEDGGMGAAQSRRVVAWKDGIALMKAWAEAAPSLFLPSDYNSARVTLNDAAKYVKWVSTARPNQSAYVAEWTWNFTQLMRNAASYHWWFDDDLTCKEKIAAYDKQLNDKLVEIWEAL